MVCFLERTKTVHSRSQRAACICLFSIDWRFEPLPCSTSHISTYGKIATKSYTQSDAVHRQTLVVVPYKRCALFTIAAAHSHNKLTSLPRTNARHTHAQRSARKYTQIHTLYRAGCMHCECGWMSRMNPYQQGQCLPNACWMCVVLWLLGFSMFLRIDGSAYVFVRNRIRSRSMCILCFVRYKSALP